MARLDLVSAPPGTALVFYGPPALQVHAMPLLSQHDLVQSAAALAAQHRASHHDSAQRDSPQRDSAQHATAQRDSAQATNTEPDQSSSLQNDRLTSHSSEHHDAADAQAQMSSTHQDLSQLPHAADSEAGDVMLTQHSSKQPWQEEEEHHRLQAELTGLGHQHTALRHQHAAGGEEDEGGDEGLFAETSVRARGGLKVTEKASPVVLDCFLCDLWFEFLQFLTMSRE